MIPGQFELTIIVDQSRGSVSSDPPGIDDCTDSCSAFFPAATVVDLTATADVTYEIMDWRGDCPSAVGSESNQIVMDSNKQCTVVFISLWPQPVADFSYTPPLPSVGEVVDFDGSSSHLLHLDGRQDPDGIILLAWDFDYDGTFITDSAGLRDDAAQVQYAFQAPGHLHRALASDRQCQRSRRLCPYP